MNQAATIHPMVRPGGHHQLPAGLGFEPDGTGFRCGDLRADPAGSGWQFSAPWPRGVDPLADPGFAGPWRYERIDDTDCRVFSLPGWLLAAADPEVGSGDEPGVFERAVDWVMSTAGGDVPTGWEPPEDPVRAGWLSADELTIQQGGVLRQVAMKREKGRLVLEMPLAEDVAPDLAGLRGDWVRRILLETQARWLLVRTAVTGDGRPVALVDLSGVPEALARPMCQAGLESLRRLAAHLVEAVEFLASSDAGSEALSQSATMAGYEQTTTNP